MRYDASVSSEIARRYEITSVLGQGGFGTVYRATLRGAGGFSKDVAIKLLKEANPPAEVLERFRDEARILGLVRDRAVVQVEPPVKLADRWAVVMEYVDGASLARILKRSGPLAPEVALEITAEIARALHRLWHQKGPGETALHLRHRDLKPSNVQVTPDGSVVLLDFGVAKATFDAREARTTTGIMGTEGYIAPERFYGNEGPTTDLFSLGVVLHEMVTGGRPNPTATGADPGGDDLRGATVRLALRMCALDPTLRPEPREVERLCTELLREAGKLGGLREWAESAVPAASRLPPDDLVGEVLTEAITLAQPSTGGSVAPVRMALFAGGTTALAALLAAALLAGFGAVVGLALVAAWAIGPADVQAPPEPVVEAPELPVVAPEPVVAPPEPEPEPEPPEEAPAAAASTGGRPGAGGCGALAGELRLDPAGRGGHARRRAPRDHADRRSPDRGGPAHRAPDPRRPLPHPRHRRRPPRAHPLPVAGRRRHLGGLPMIPCADPAALVEVAEQAVFELRVDDARATLGRIEEAFGCAVVDPEVLARFFDVEGALLVHAGDRDGATLRFAAARAIVHDGLDPMYGSKVRAVSDATARAPIESEIDLSPRPAEDDDVRVDTALVSLPVSVTSGLHLVQVGPPGTVAFGELVLVEPGGRLVVSTHRLSAPAADLPAPLPAPGAPSSPSPEPGRRGPSVGLLVTSGALAALGGVSAGLALREQDGAIPSATSVDAVDAAWTRQRAFGWTAYGLWSGAALAAGLSFAL